MATFVFRLPYGLHIAINRPVDRVRATETVRLSAPGSNQAGLPRKLRQSIRHGLPIGRIHDRARHSLHDKMIVCAGPGRGDDREPGSRRLEHRHAKGVPKSREDEDLSLFVYRRQRLLVNEIDEDDAGDALRHRLPTQLLPQRPPADDPERHAGVTLGNVSERLQQMIEPLAVYQPPNEEEAHGSLDLPALRAYGPVALHFRGMQRNVCLLYTSDAADDLLC